MMGLNLKFLSPVIVLCVISLVVLFSIDPFYFRAQLIYLVLAIVAYYIFSKVNLDFISEFYLPIYFISIFMLLFILFIGHSSHGAVRWLSFFGVNLQFSEILKPFLALSLAKFISKEGSLRSKFYMSIVFLLPLSFLIFKQPDLGSALVYFLSAMLSFLIIGFPLVYFLTILAPIIVLFPVIWRFFLHSYQKDRLLSFLKLSYDPLGASYNMIQSIISIGSGGFMGKGLGLGTQSALHFLPEKHTDFMFASLSEETGFLGSAIIVIIFMYLFFKIMQIISVTNDQFYKILGIISFSIIFIEFILNIGMNLGLLPVVGVALPFVSYGGSSLISTFILLGFLNQISQKQTNEKVIEIR